MKGISLYQASRKYLKISFLSFGGPAAQIALMHKAFVEEESWLNEEEYLSALSFCMLLPGPEAMQLITYIGWKLHGVIGGLVAGLAFLLPGAIVIYSFALLYAYFGEIPIMEAAFLGVKSAVLVIIVEALMRISKRALKRRTDWLIALFAFIGIFFFELAYPLIIFITAIYGYFFAPQSTKDVERIKINHSFPKTLKTAIFWLAIWFIPIALIGWITKWGLPYDIAIFFSKQATVTFGGAYAVLGYMSQEVVFNLNWLSTEAMMDGLGLAETTPGPLILVTEFVGFLAGFRQSGIGLATLSSIITLWATFIPCFLWIFVGAPYVDWISAQPKLRGILSAITAAVVGVILSISIWFSLHVLFDDVSKTQIGALVIWKPAIISLDWHVLFIAGLSAYFLLFRHMNIILVLGICACLGLIIS